MDNKLGSYWYLEHVTTGKKIILQSGENTLGRHSRCKCVLKDYSFLSREHAKIIIEDESVLSLEPLNALNGVYINDIKIESHTQPLTAGDQIGFGVASIPIVPNEYAIFILKQMHPNMDDIIVISDDEDSTPDIKDTKVEIQVKNEAKEVDNKTNSSDVVTSTPRTLHLPKLSEVKEEILSVTSKEIENIFGEPDEELLDSVLKINPYVYKKLNNINAATDCDKICDGDVIELPEEFKLPQPEASPNAAVSPVMNDDDNNHDDYNDYDDNFAMSQAVLQEMKEEMADEPNSDDEATSQNEDDLLSFKAETMTENDDDEIVLIEDEDDEELLNKVADWSSKLFSQNVMSQVYPMEEQELFNDEDDLDREVGKMFNETESSDIFDMPLFTRRKSKALRIDSSDSEDESPTFNNAAKSHTPELIPIQRCNVRLKSINLEQGKVDNWDNISSNRNMQTDKCTTHERSRTISAPTDLEDTVNKSSKKNQVKLGEKTPNSRLLQRSKSFFMERPLGVPTDKKKQKSPKNTSELDAIPSPGETAEKQISIRLRNRSKSMCVVRPLSSSSKTVDTKKPPPPPEASSKTINHTNDAALHLPAKPKQLSARLRSRSNSCCMEEISSSEKPKAPARKSSKTVEEDIPEPEVSTPGRGRLQKRRRSCYKDDVSAEESVKSVKVSPNLPSSSENLETHGKKKISQRLLNRSRSCYVERSPDSTETAEDSNSKSPVHVDKLKACPKIDETIRGPLVISPPHLPTGRGKLRGISAVVNKETERRNNILQKQRSLDYQAQMKEKWLQKPKDEDKECQENKEKRRELLKKLAEKTKPEAATSTSNELKRKHINIPTLGNCNRGEFLTKEIQPPTTKKPKLEQAKAIPKKPMPARRATIDSFSQQFKVPDPVIGQPLQNTRATVRKDAEKARSLRTCNRVTFADMDRDFNLRMERDRKSKRNRHVRFNDNVQIILIDRIKGANRKVGHIKDTQKLSLSTYADRREWALANLKQDNFKEQIRGDILDWSNQWLKLRSVDAVAETGVLMPIPTEFENYKQYTDILFPLMKIELLATIERDYKISKTTFQVNLQSYSKADGKKQHPRYLLVTRYNQRITKKFDLYTLTCENKFNEVFAFLSVMLRISDNVYELIFEILQNSVSMKVLSSIKKLTVRPVVDNIRVEQGALSAVHQLRHSPLFQRILHPSDNVLSCDIKKLDQGSYRGFKRLNDEQLDICMRTWHRLVDDSTPSITLIQGPPGTGKSELISNLTLQCMYGSMNHTLDRKILICAHSNAAVDNITYNLNSARQCMRNARFQLLRFGVFEKIDPRVRDVSLDQYLSTKRAEKRNRLTAEYIESLTKQEEELSKEIAELKKRSVQISYLQQVLQSKLREWHLVKEQLNPPLTLREEAEFAKMFVQQSNIVCTTLSSCVKLAQYIDYFDACIIDEATQCTEPWTLLPLRFGVRNLVLVGDTQQLPATVLSQKALKFGLGNSMFHRIQRNLKQQVEKSKVNHFVHTKLFKLIRQYRMHPEICKWPNFYFYKNQLINGSTTSLLNSPIIPYCVINLSYTRDTNDVSSRSISNHEEAKFVGKLLIELNKYMPADQFKYGLITPYSNHSSTLSKVIPSSMKITPQTIDAYQGQQCDVVILSNARTRGVGFLTNYQRLNVAITRPRRCLIICGNFDDLKSVNLWRHLLDDARKRQVYFSLSRNDAEDLNKSLVSKLLAKPNVTDDKPAENHPSSK